VARLFVAVWPPDDVISRLARVPRPEARGVRWIPAANLHVTLRFLGEAEPDDARAALDGTRFPRAVAELGPRVRRLGGRSLVLPVAGLQALAGAVTVATAGVGKPPDTRPFTGHITLARLRRGAADLPRDDLVDDQFGVEEVLLVRSELSSDGARYEPIGRWDTATGND
jgi:2'-5' RNA ligase